MEREFTSAVALFDFLTDVAARTHRHGPSLDFRIVRCATSWEIDIRETLLRGYVGRAAVRGAAVWVQIDDLFAPEEAP